MQIVPLSKIQSRARSQSRLWVAALALGLTVGVGVPASALNQPVVSPTYAGSTPGLVLAAKPVAAKVDLNSATLDDLVALPGIGESRASAILALRDERGGFRTVEELLEVKGIGPKALEKLRPLLKLGKAMTP